jgi:hypothetical protein
MNFDPGRNHEKTDQWAEIDGRLFWHNCGIVVLLARMPLKSA